MSETSDNEITAALTFKVPSKVGWSVQRCDQSWTGSELAGLFDCLAKEGNGGLVTLSLSLIFELAGGGRTVGRPDDLPQF